MARKTSGLSSLVGRLSPSHVSGASLGSLLAPISLINDTKTGIRSPLKAGTSHDMRALSFGTHTIPKEIQFGRPSNSRTSSSSSSNPVASLLKQTVSGGIANAVTGGLGGIAGIGGIVSGILGLFGGHSTNTLPPLVRFQLPRSQQQTVYVSSGGRVTYSGDAVEQQSSSVQEPSLQYQSSQIAQAVKNALLNSSSLNDVIAEI